MREVRNALHRGGKKQANFTALNLALGLWEVYKWSPENSKPQTDYRIWNRFVISIYYTSGSRHS